MSEGKSFYITTTIPYVNADPHIGFAMEVIQADALARAKRLEGVEVFFNTGSDEHGQKIKEASEKAGKEIQEYVDHFASEFEKLLPAPQAKLIKTQRRKCGESANKKEIFMKRSSKASTAWVASAISPSGTWRMGSA